MLTIRKGLKGLVATGLAAGLAVASPAVAGSSPSSSTADSSAECSQGAKLSTSYASANAVAKTGALDAHIIVSTPQGGALPDWGGDSLVCTAQIMFRKSLSFIQGQPVTVSFSLTRAIATATGSGNTWDGPGAVYLVGEASDWSAVGDAVVTHIEPGEKSLTLVFTPNTTAKGLLELRIDLKASVSGLGIPQGSAAGPVSPGSAEVGVDGTVAFS